MVSKPWTVVYCIANRYRYTERGLEHFGSTSKYLLFRRTTQKEGVAEVLRLSKSQVVEKWKE